MHAGKVASLSLVVVVTVVTMAIRMFTYWAWELETAAPSTRLWAFTAVVAVVSAAVLIPLGFMMDRSMTNLRRHIEKAASNEHSVMVDTLSLLRPITRAFIGAVDQFRQREQGLRNQLGDLEIRHRVSEAERRQIEAVLHALRDAVVVTDAFNEIVMANQTAATVLGFDLKASIHKSIDEIIADQKLCQLIREARDTANFNDTRHVEQVVGGGKGSHGGQTEARVVDVTLACVENHKHDVGGVVTILHDLTREREVSQMKSDFVSKASHELRTPLSSIRAYVEMLVDGEATDEKGRQEFYRIIQNETDRLGRLIDNMLNISRIEAGIVQIEREHVDIKALVDRAIHTLEVGSPGTELEFAL